jgi:hypothetical protein
MIGDHIYVFRVKAIKEEQNEFVKMKQRISVVIFAYPYTKLFFRKRNKKCKNTKNIESECSSC